MLFGPAQSCSQRGQPALTSAPAPWAGHAGPDSADTSMPVVLVANRAIEANEELNFDYNPRQEARCSSAACAACAACCLLPQHAAWSVQHASNVPPKSPAILSPLCCCAGARRTMQSLATAARPTAAATCLPTSTRSSAGSHSRCAAGVLRRWRPYAVLLESGCCAASSLARPELRRVACAQGAASGGTEQHGSTASGAQRQESRQGSGQQTSRAGQQRQQQQQQQQQRREEAEDDQSQAQTPRPVSRKAATAADRRKHMRH